MTILEAIGSCAILWHVGGWMIAGIKRLRELIEAGESMREDYNG